jgi:hypothetical protein
MSYTAASSDFLSSCVASEDTSPIRVAAPVVASNVGVLVLSICVQAFTSSSRDARMTVSSNVNAVSQKIFEFG